MEGRRSAVTPENGRSRVAGRVAPVPDAGRSAGTPGSWELEQLEKRLEKGAEQHKGGTPALCTLDG